jgi:lysophospholipase L1-like esterase
MTTRYACAFTLAAVSLRALALVVALAGTAVTASASPRDARGNHSYLALGDSIVFGYITADGYAYVNANNFVGYPDYVGDDLGFKVTNASCPGETTSGFIDSAGPDYSCHTFYRKRFPLHIPYSSLQLDYAMNYLKRHRQTRLVTIGLGANDGFLLQDSCSGESDPLECIQAGLQDLLGTVSFNMTEILADLRSTGYRGVIVVVNYYSPDYTDENQTALTAVINQSLSQAVTTDNRTVVADAFTAFQDVAASLPEEAKGETCKTGLLNSANPADEQWTCDIHPSLSGQQLLAKTVVAAYEQARHRNHRHR